MSSFELNKIFAAVLIAGIVAMLSGFVAELLVHHEALAQNAVEIEVADAGGAGGAKAEAKAEPILHLIATADVAQGEKLSKACAACHSFDKGGANKVGPNLWGVVGGSRGGHAGFEYSAGMKAMGGSWSYTDLNKFLWKPKKFLGDTKMSYAGMKKPEDRAALIAWLHSLGSSVPMPSAAQIAAEAAESAPSAAAGEAPVEAPAR